MGFGVTLGLTGNVVFSAFGDPRLVDNLGKEYLLDWRRVGFGKPDPAAPYVIGNGTSVARFVGPIDPEASELRLLGGVGGVLVSFTSQSSPRVRLALSE